MGNQIFVNLPVKDLDRSVSFFSGLGFEFNPEFTDDKATCMIVADNIYVMLLKESYFQTFTRKPVSDARKNTEVLVALSCDSRSQVDELFEKAVGAGASEASDPQDHGFMYGRSIEDLDGHIWELFYMEPGAA